MEDNLPSFISSSWKTNLEKTKCLEMNKRNTPLHYMMHFGSSQKILRHGYEKNENRAILGYFVELYFYIQGDKSEKTNSLKKVSEEPLIFCILLFGCSQNFFSRDFLAGNNPETLCSFDYSRKFYKSSISYPGRWIWKRLKFCRRIAQTLQCITHYPMVAARKPFCWFPAIKVLKIELLKIFWKFISNSWGTAASSRKLWQSFWISEKPLSQTYQ